jgi:hypothetical protein
VVSQGAAKVNKNDKTEIREPKSKPVRVLTKDALRQVSGGVVSTPQFPGTDGAGKDAG